MQLRSSAASPPPNRHDMTSVDSVNDSVRHLLSPDTRISFKQKVRHDLMRVPVEGLNRPAMVYLRPAYLMGPLRICWVIWGSKGSNSAANASEVSDKATRTRWWYVAFVYGEGAQKQSSCLHFKLTEIGRRYADQPEASIMVV